jgi:UbiD family decarboxylase
MQRYDATTTGMHWQIGKGGGFHYFEAEQQNKPLPVTVYMGGPPAMMLAAVAPLPEDVPELMLASLLAGSKIRTAANPLGNDRHRVIAETEFALVGHVPPQELKPEGPFGDHYGYYSLQHDYPVFHADAVFHRKDAIYPATIVGKPKQEDFFIGDYLQELAIAFVSRCDAGGSRFVELWRNWFSFTCCGGCKRTVRKEALSAGFRILGEGQLTLTNFFSLPTRRKTFAISNLCSNTSWHVSNGIATFSFSARRRSTRWTMLAAKSITAAKRS